MFPGLGVHWVVFGPSERARRPREGGVLRHYTQCRPEAATHIKTIVNTFFVERTTVHPHNFEYRCAPEHMYMSHRDRCSTLA